jgi:hypothetical protein
MSAKAAEQLARRAHERQFRRDGTTPYITHPEAVVNRLKGENDDVIAAAWLHDVLEDTDTTVDDLRRHEINETVIDAVLRLTKPIGSYPYALYLRGIKSNEIACKVKVQDILANLSDVPTRRQVIRYSKALLYLVDGWRFSNF